MVCAGCVNTYTYSFVNFQIKMTVFISSECTCVWVCFWMYFAFLFWGLKKTVFLQSCLFLFPLTGDTVLDDIKCEVKVDQEHFHTLKLYFLYVFDSMLYSH